MERQDRDRDSRGWSRRQFVRSGAAAAATAWVWTSGKAVSRAEEKAPREIPRAVLGKTGEKVPILALGTACLGHKNGNRPDPNELIPVFSEAIDSGITYVDTARIYGGAEAALKAVLKTRRGKVFLATKVWANTAEEAEKSFSESLKNLGVEAVDLLHLHSTGDKNIDEVLGEKGSWGFLQKMKKEGKTRFVGLTGHSRPANFVRIIEETKQVDVVMIAMNFVDYHVYGFEEKVLPVARKHQVGVLCMKVFGGIQGGFKNYPAKTPFPSQMKEEFHRDAVRYAKSLEGVTGMVIGVHTAEQLRQNIQLVLETEPFSKEELARLRERGKEFAGDWGPRFGPVA